MTSVEDQTSLFEDILHPEMMEALDSLQVRYHTYWPVASRR